MKKIASFLLAVILVFSIMIPVCAGDDTLPFENSSFFTDGDYKIHYRTYGEENSAGNIMMLHGFGLSSVSFDGIASVYAEKGFRVFTVDLPNFGYSTRESASTELKDREEIVYDLMESIGGKWILCGHSMGGGVAANIAIDHPELISSLVLFAPQTSKESSVSVDSPINLITRTVFDAVISCGVRIPGAIRLLVAYSFSSMKYAATYDVSKIADPLKIRHTGAGMAVMTAHAKGTDIDAFGKLQMPICIITSDNDKVADKTNLNSLINSGAPNMSVFSVDEGGHMMFEYDPQATAELTYNTIYA